MLTEPLGVEFPDRKLAENVAVLGIKSFAVRFFCLVYVEDRQQVCTVLGY